MSNGWRDQLAGARMQVDQQFNDRIVNSQFSNQEWGLIMTAVEFDIESPEKRDEAQLVARTENISQIIPELENLPQGMGGAPGGSSWGSGLVSSLRNALGFGNGSASGGDAEMERAATELVEEYALELQNYLEEQGRWEEICKRAVSEETGSTD